MWYDPIRGTGLFTKTVRKVVSLSVFSDAVTKQLQTEPPVEATSLREGGKDRDTGEPIVLTYLTDWYVIDRLNEVFDHFWNYSVDDVSQVQLPDGHVVFYAICTLTVHGVDEIDSYKLVPVVHSDVGTGTTRGRNGPTGDAVDMAVKGAVSDAIKRCARQLGVTFGNSLYNASNPLHEAAEEYHRKNGTHPILNPDGSFKKKKSSGGGRKKSSQRQSQPADVPEPNGPNGTYICEECGDELWDGGSKTRAQRAADSKKYQGRILCYPCGKKES